MCDRSEAVRPIAASATVPRELLQPVPREQLRHITRDLAACEIDRWLRVLSRQDARCRSVFGRLAAIFLRSQAHHRLGFGRVGDYSSERLGISAREVQTAARLATALLDLPCLAAAFDAGELSWTQLRILVTVATRRTEDHWLGLARGTTVRALEGRVRGARMSVGVTAHATDASGGRGREGRWRDRRHVGGRRTGRPVAPTVSAASAAALAPRGRDGAPHARYGWAGLAGRGGDRCRRDCGDSGGRGGVATYG